MFSESVKRFYYFAMESGGWWRGKPIWRRQKEREERFKLLIYTVEMTRQRGLFRCKLVIKFTWEFVCIFHSIFAAQLRSWRADQKSDNFPFSPYRDGNINRAANENYFSISATKKHCAWKYTLPATGWSNISMDTAEGAERDEQSRRLFINYFSSSYLLLLLRIAGAAAVWGYSGRICELMFFHERQVAGTSARSAPEWRKLWLRN